MLTTAAPVLATTLTGAVTIRAATQPDSNIPVATISTSERIAVSPPFRRNAILAPTLRPVPYREVNAQDEWRRGRRLVVAAAFGLGAGSSLLQFTSSLFVLPLTREFGWSRGQLATASAVSIVAAFLAPAIGWLADRRGVRPVTIVSTLGLAAAYVGLAAQTGSFALYVGLFLLFGLFGVGTTGVTWTRAVGSAFEARRGLALGLSFAGVSVAGIVVPPLLSQIIAADGWRSGYLMLACIALAAGLPAAWFGLPRGLAAQVGGQAAAPEPEPRSTFLRAPAFWLLAACMLAINLPGAGLLSQLQPLLADRGIGLQAAAGLLSVYAGAILVGRLLTGFLLDRLSPPLVAAASMLLPALGCLLLLEAPLTLPLAVAAVAALGLSQGAETDVLGFMIARYFGMARYSTLFAILIAVVVIGNSVGTVFFGRSFDATGGYDLAIALSVGCFAAGAAFAGALTLCRPRAG